MDAPRRPLEAERERMLQLLRREIRDPRIIEAFAAVPREAFVPESFRGEAYEDRALPIGGGQTISQPLMVAMMIQVLEVRSEDRVLEIGTGSGYAAAVLAKLAREVVTVERVEALLAAARATLHSLGIENVHTHLAGPVLGRGEDAPYDAILVSAGAPHVPRVLLEQLAPGGRLAIPVGTARAQQLVTARRTDHGIELRRHGPCAFVPLIGDEAWRAAG
jgi:protein-L-isoaspartate(D-aspartate) O-methyltransferase